MIACLDVHYNDDYACAAAVVFNDWSATGSIKEYSEVVQWNKKYEPGKFYRRELEPLLKVIEKIAEPIRLYVIDAYCYLSTDHSPGLGAHLYKALNEQIPIVGVAKNKFKNTDHAEEVFRGQSGKPLYVTSAGVSQVHAASNIAAMTGKFRIPDFLKIVDQKARLCLKSASKACSKKLNPD